MLLERISLERQTNIISFTIFENSKMAASMDGPKPNDIARCLNALTLMNMQDIVTLKVPTIIGCFQYSKGDKHSYVGFIS